MKVYVLTTLKFHDIDSHHTDEYDGCTHDTVVFVSHLHAYMYVCKLISIVCVPMHVLFVAYTENACVHAWQLPVCQQKIFLSQSLVWGLHFKVHRYQVNLLNIRNL